jgi:hypothetical protein
MGRDGWISSNGTRRIDYTESSLKLPFPVIHVTCDACSLRGCGEQTANPSFGYSVFIWLFVSLLLCLHIFSARISSNPLPSVSRDNPTQMGQRSNRQAGNKQERDRRIKDKNG